MLGGHVIGIAHAMRYLNTLIQNRQLYTTHTLKELDYK